MKEAPLNCELSANKNKFECVKDLDIEQRASVKCKRTMMNVFGQVKALRLDGSSASFMQLAKLYSELASIKKSCGTWQKAWNAGVDYVAFKLR